MKVVHVTASRSYDVIIGPGLLTESGTYIRERVGGKKACIVTDDTVATLYADTVTESLAGAGYEVLRFVIPHGEASKCATNFVALLEHLAENRLTRSDVLVALGGGVVGDLTGFAASAYLRGVAFVQLPTTVLAAVDSSVGGKTAIDLPQGKNLVGAFYQPHLVLCDINAFDTLPEEIFCDGCGEIIKYGMIANEQLLEDLEEPIRENMERIVATCVEMKRDIVAQDEYDVGVRQLLNLGHTIGHGIEAVSGYRISHGSAIAAGMVIVARAAWKKGWCDRWCVDKVISLNHKYHLPTGTTYGADELYRVMTNDKKRSGDSISLIVPVGRGRSEARSIPVDMLKEILELGLSEVVTVKKTPHRGIVPKLPSKSVAHRMLIAASLSGNDATCPDFSEDVVATKRCLSAFAAGEREFDCGESGSTFRFLLPVAGALGCEGSFLLKGRLAQRPLTGLYEQLTTHGMELSPEGTNPFEIKGRLQAGVYSLPGNVSSQFVSGLLFALPLLEGDSEVDIQGVLESRPYVELTVATLRKAGIVVKETETGYEVPGGQTYHLDAEGELAVEGDWSNAAYWMTLAHLTGEKLVCEGLDEASVQGDRRIVELLDCLKQPGETLLSEIAGENASVVACKATSDELCRVLDLRDTPDLAPILSVAAAVASGTTVFTSVSRLRLKECDRLLAIQSVLNALGAEVSIIGHRGEVALCVRGVEALHGGMVDSFNDHRIAMAAAIAAQVADGEVVITDAGAVKKSYPDFFEVLRSLEVTH